MSQLIKTDEKAAKTRSRVWLFVSLCVVSVLLIAFAIYYFKPQLSSFIGGGDKNSASKYACEGDASRQLAGVDYVDRKTRDSIAERVMSDDRHMDDEVCLVGLAMHAASEGDIGASKKYLGVLETKQNLSRISSELGYSDSDLAIRLIKEEIRQAENPQVYN